MQVKIKFMRIWVSLVFIIVLGGSHGRLVAPLLAQQAPTATPDAEGVIYAVVQANDTLWTIAARAGLTLAELLALNNLQESDFIQPGQRLIVGYGAPPVTPTTAVTPSPTATRRLPTPPPPTATRPSTAVCLSAFEDSNGNGLHDLGETLRAAVAFTVYSNQGVAANYITDGLSEPYCIELAPGNYQITRSIATGETLTSNGDYAVLLNAGDRLYLTFGGQRQGEAAVATTLPSAAYPAYETAVVAATAVVPSTAPDAASSLIPLTAAIIGSLLLILIMARLVFRRFR